MYLKPRGWRASIWDLIFSDKPLLNSFMRPGSAWSYTTSRSVVARSGRIHARSWSAGKMGLDVLLLAGEVVRVGGAGIVSM